MPQLIDLVRCLLDEGRILLREPPVIRAEERDRVEELLANAFADYRLDIAGPRIDFSAEIALKSLDVLAWSCWFLLHRGEAPEHVSRMLPNLPNPRSASEHLSGELLLRFLPQVYRRALSVNPQDPLTLRLKDTLRRWPLSGLLADIDESPFTEVELDGHPGLLLLYAERLAVRPRPAWLPGETGRAYVELVFGERGLKVPSAERSLT